MNLEQSAQAELLLNIVCQLVQELHPGRAMVGVGLSSHIDRELGLSSLGRAELLARIERAFKVQLPHDVLANAEQVLDLLRALERAAGQPPTTTTVQQSSIVVPAPAPAPGGSRPDHATTLVDMLEWHADRHGDAAHLLLSDGTGEQLPISYRDLVQRARCVARGLQAAGIEPGDRVALMLPTGEAFFVAFYGILYAAAVPVPIYPPLRPSQIEEHLRRQVVILGNAGASLMVTIAQARGFARLLRAHLPTLRGIKTVEDLRDAGTTGKVTLPPVVARGVALIQYTSGSTGDPKGVVLTHANVMANIRGISDALDLPSAQHVLVSWLPLYHDMGLIGAWFGALYQGATAVIMSPLHFLSRPASWLQTITRCKGTFSVAPNFAFELCTSRIPDSDLVGLDLTSLRILLSGAEPVDPSTLRRFSQRFAPYGLDPGAITPVYGLAENAVGLTFPPPGRGPKIDRIQREALTTRGRALPIEDAEGAALELVACGWPMPRHEVRIVDELGHEMPEREQGRVQFRGPSATRGYYENPSATQLLFDGDWLETGDLGYIAAGELYLTGRVKDVVIRAGRNIYPHEIEQAVGEVEGVRRGCVAVFGSVDPVAATERLVVVAETRQSDGQRREALQAAISQRTAELLDAPADVVVLASPHAVPKTSSGKLRRQATRELFEEGYLQGQGLQGQGHSVAYQLVRMALYAAFASSRQRLRTALAAAWAVWFWMLLLSLSLVTWIALMLLPCRRWRWPVAHVLARSLFYMAGLPLSVRGEQPRPTGKSPGVVFVVNHASYVDGLVIVAALKHPVALVVKRDLDGGPLLRLPLERLGVLYVERFDRQQSLADIQAAEQALCDGRSVVFFPEGTLSRRPGLLEFQMGAFHVAAEAGADVVALTLIGTRSVLRDGQWWPRRRPIEVKVAEKITVRPAGAQDAFAAAVALRDEARALILAACGEPDLAGEGSLLTERAQE